jgi:predicted RNA polymerase sigma factor
MLAKSQEWFQKYLDSPAGKEDHRQTVEFLQGELLRRLGKFDEAEQQFDRIAKLNDFKKEPFPRLITQELSLIQAKDTAPHEMARK